MSSMVRKILLVFAASSSFVISSSLPIFAQATGSIRGLVTDSSGASIANAKVTVTETETGIDRSVPSDSHGSYSLSQLRPTQYSIRVESEGFKAYIQSGLTLMANQDETIDVHLDIGSTSQAVEVSSQAASVDLTSQTLTTVVGGTEVNQLPLNGRAVAELIGTVPGASAVSPTVIMSQSSLPGSVSPSINGSRTNSTSYLLDGANYLDEYYNTNIPFPFPDALQEFSVQTSNYSAHYGENSGGVVNVVTKSGTTQFHGNLFEYNRNAIFNARNAFATARDPLKRNQFGGTIGGPLNLPLLSRGQHKLFFFGGYQGSRIRTASTSSSYVPTARELAGDFSAYLDANSPDNPTGVVTKIIDPTTGKPFPGNYIQPSTRFDPAAVNLTSYLPLGTGNGRAFYSSRQTEDINEYVVRLDRELTPNNRILLRYYQDDIVLQPQYNPSDIRVYSLGYDTPVKNVMAQDTHSFGSNILNVASFTYSTVPVNKIAASNSPNPASFGVSNIWQPPTKVIQSIGINGFFSISGGAVGPFNASDIGGSDDLTWVKGAHTLALGMSVGHAIVHLGDLYLAPGSFSFTSDVTGNALASFLLGKMKTFQQGAGEFKDNENWFWAFYVNDSWRATRRLTLNYGLRYEPYTPWNEVKGRYEQFRPADARAGVKSQVYSNAPAGLFFRGDPGVPDRGVEGSMTNFAPRLGFAYDLDGRGRSSLRGGFGMFYDSHTAGVINNQQVDVTPFSTQVSLTDPVGPFSNPYLGQTNPFPVSFPPSKDIAFPTPVKVVTFDPSTKFQVPLTYGYNLIAEQALPRSVLFQIAYVGTRSLHNRTTVELNPAIYIPGSSLSTDNRRPYQGYGHIYMNSQSGNIHYDSLQVSVKKQAARHVTLRVGYTFSKNLDDIPPGGSNNDIGADSVATLPSYTPNYSAFDYGRSGNDRRHRFVGSYVLRLPELPNFNVLARTVLGGWQASGIVSLQSGGGLTITTGTDVSKTGIGNDRAVIVNRAIAYDGNACKGQTYCKNWLNSAAFATPATGSFGSRGKGSFQGPGSFSWNMGLAKEFPIKDALALQFRGEFFNVFNRVNYSDPATSLSSANFGKITGAGDPRIGQLALKLNF